MTMRRLTIGIASLGIATTLGLLGRAPLTAAGPDDRPDEPKVYFQNEVEGRTTILHLVPNGMRVKKGAILAELDSAKLRRRLDDQVIAVAKAQAELSAAKNARDVAELALKEYQEGTSAQECERLQGETALADTALALAEERLKATAKQPEGGLVSRKQAGLDCDRARNDLLRARKALEVFEAFTRPRALARLQADLETIRADLRAKQVIVQVETTKESRLVRQIDKCKIKSPIDGKAIHSRIDGGDEIREGTVVREGQEVLRMIPDRVGETPRSKSSGNRDGPNRPRTTMRGGSTCER